MSSGAHPSIHLVGLPEPKHPGGARYVGFAPYLPARFVPAPQGYRYYWTPAGRRVDALVARMAGHPDYSMGLALMEASAALHMLGRRGAVYHSVRGDVHLLPRIARKTGNFVVATFHEVVDAMARSRELPRLAASLHGAILLGECQRAVFAPHMPAERIFVVHHSVDTDFFRPAGHEPDEPVCITVGAYMRDPDTLAAAMRLVWQQNPKVRLIAVGTARPGYINAAPALDDPRVTLLDRVSDQELLQAYHASTIAILSMFDAVANNALLEHMACGLPVVGTDVGAVGEYLGEKAGILFPPGDAGALAAAILRLLDDRDLRMRMGAAGRTRALELSHRAIAERLWDVYSKVEALG